MSDVGCRLSEAERTLPISALRHMRYCERSAALNHVDGVWADNRFTTEGSLQHARVDSGEEETRCGVRVLRTVALVLQAYGFAGIADVIEFHQEASAWRPIPVEYKRGKRKRHQRNGPDVQLCAQALALEEMMGGPIEYGYIFHIESKKRRKVVFDAALRTQTVETMLRFREIVESESVPEPVNDSRCEDCSLISRCLPQIHRDTLPSLAQATARALKDA
jgi:CRISPR-associated exonuclease Cas4